MSIIGCCSLAWVRMICLVLAAGLSPVTADEAAWVIPYEAATDYVGESCVAYGTVVAARTVGARCFLNFHEDYRRHLTVVIPSGRFRSRRRRCTKAGRSRYVVESANTRAGRRWW